MFSCVSFNQNQLEQDPMMQLIIVTSQIEGTTVHRAPAKDSNQHYIHIYVVDHDPKT